MNLSPEEKDRFDNLSTSDQLKLEKIFSMMQAEKNIEIDENGHVDDYTEEIAENRNTRLSNEVSDRIEGFLSIPMKKVFLDAGMDLIQDLIEDEPFDIDDVITHLGNELSDYLDSFYKQGDRLAGLEENHAMQGVEAELESGEIGNMDALTEDSSVKDLLDKIRKHLENKFEDKYRKFEYDLYIDSLERDIKRGEFDGVESISMSDHEDDFVTYIDEKSTLEENKALKEHFNRFMFKKYK